MTFATLIQTFGCVAFFFCNANGFNIIRLLPSSKQVEVSFKKSVPCVRSDTTELKAFQLPMPPSVSNLGFPSAASWMNGYLKAIDMHNNDLLVTPRGL